MKRFLRNTEGATAIEYGLILALIVIVIVASVSALGTQVSSSYTNTANAFPN